MHTSGLVLDAYDDPEVVRELPPSLGDLAKTAFSVSPADIEKLPDDVFALVVPGSGLRKFACLDAGSVALSVAAFTKHGHKLGEEAQHVCAENLRGACSLYGLPDPVELFKQAGLGGMALSYAAKNPGRVAMTAITAPAVATGTRDKIHENLGQVRHHEAMGKHASDTSSETREGPVGPSGGRQWATVSSFESPPAQFEVKQAERFALPSAGKYPLDSYVQVKAAQAYYAEHHTRLAPDERREYCQNLVKRASELGLPCSDAVNTYGSSTYASDMVVQAALQRRANSAPEAAEFLGKLAEARPRLEPEEFCEILATFDKTAGLDEHYGPLVPDPYVSTFGPTKLAEDDLFAEEVGGTAVTAAALREAATNRRGVVKSVFGDPFCDKFFKDPVGTFRGLPLLQKKLLARIASDTAPRG
jgi:hypothetical protein